MIVLLSLQSAGQPTLAGKPSVYNMLVQGVGTTGGLASGAQAVAPHLMAELANQAALYVLVAVNGQRGGHSELQGEEVGSRAFK